MERPITCLTSCHGYFQVAEAGGHYSDTTASAGGSDDEGSTAATDGSTLRTSPAEQVSFFKHLQRFFLFLYFRHSLLLSLFTRNEKFKEREEQRGGIIECCMVGGSNVWDIFYVRVVVVVARVARAVEARAEEVL